MWLRIVLVAVLGSMPVVAVQPAGDTGRIRVEVLGLKTEGGEVHFAVFNRKEGFGDGDYSVVDGLSPVRDGKCAFSVTGLRFGEYAILLGHDVNGDGDISRNPFSRELKGASNYTSKMWSWPDFEKAKFVLDREELTVEIHLY